MKIRNTQRKFGTRIHRPTTEAIGLSSVLLFLPFAAMAGSTGVEFQPIYQFIYDAATGYLGRAIALAGGLVGLGIGAATGKILIAAVGIVLAIFGALGPAIVDGIFASAVIF